METFKGVSPHSPLDQNRNEIRIINLLPDIFDKPIKCELEHIVLDPKAEYEAVSYCWGDASITKPISLNGQPYQVTESLMSGLNYLRRETSARRLWVDSLCINQSDNVERSCEILKMRDIYKQAKSVLIWLGDYRPYTRNHVKKIFDYITRLGNSPNASEDKGVMASMGYDDIWPIHHELRKFLEERAWFRRMWILQEVSVRPEPCIKNSKTTPNLICGHLQLSFAYLRDVQSYWVTIHSRRLVFPPICRTLQDLCDIWKMHQHLVREGAKSEMTAGHQLAWFLSSVAGKFEASNQRDVIYAARGLLTMDVTPPELLPNYGKKLSEVLTEHACYIFDDLKAPDILQFNSMRTEGLPSWVPDWKFHASYPIVFWRKPRASFHMKVIGKLHAIEVEIITFTQIEAVGPKFKLNALTDDQFSSWSKFFSQAERRLHKEVAPFGFASFPKALWHLLLLSDLNTRNCLDLGFYLAAVRDGPPDYLSWTIKISSNSGPHMFGGLITEEILETVSESIKARYLFRGSDNSIGIMGQHDIRPSSGDLVCSIKGACSEFVLRPLKDGYRIIGMCERTSMGTVVSIGQVALGDCAGGSHLMGVLKKLWEKESLQRVIIY
ncbi:HET-domain-containing protein [Xylariaceae sp. FL1651]|nr:HET-domain-containing protein [Xylariaceae sp. FL1651]